MAFPKQSDVEIPLLRALAENGGSATPKDLAARILIVGHHGSRTSSRQAFLNAIGASTYIVSSGPHKYQSVVLPDADIISELSPRGQVFRTDRNDAACKVNPAKVGPDNDGQPGGCDNVRISILATGALTVAYVAQ